jgi:hypothetical protein
LVREVFRELAGFEVPNLDKSVHRAGNQVVAIGGESGTLCVRLVAKLRARTCKMKDGWRWMEMDE